MKTETCISASKFNLAFSVHDAGELTLSQEPYADIRQIPPCFNH